MCWVGKETDTRYLICSYLKANDGSQDKSWPLILESFDKLAQPKPAGEWGGICLFQTSDLDFVCNDVGFLHYNGVSMCGLCNANTTDLPHNNYHRDAPWRTTIKSNDDLLAAMRRPLHPLAASPLFSKHTYRLDLLHILDHHGAASSVVANVFALHVSKSSQVLPGDTQEARINSLNDDIRGYYSACNIQNRMPPWS